MVKPVGVSWVRSSRPRVSSVTAGQEELIELARRQRQFALDLYRRLAAVEPEQNLVFSPHSVTLALAMAQAGARGRTAEEMRQLLGLPQRNAHQTVGLLADTLRLDMHPATTWRVANRLLIDAGISLEQAFLDALAENYDAPVGLVDFSNDGARERARRDVTAWAEEATAGRIHDALPSLPEDTRLLIVNAVYLKALWKDPFNRGRTRRARFHVRSGETCKVQMMTTESYRYMHYVEDEDLQAVCLPYLGDSLSMLLVRPRRELGVLEAALDDIRFARLLETTTSVEVLLEMPRFRIDGTAASLTGHLAAMGMASAFGRDADFTGIGRRAGEPLFIADLRHRAFLEVDEQGTEAAAVTTMVAVGGLEELSPPPRVKLTLDRPFLFAVVDTRLGVVQFMGRVTRPEE